MLLIIIKIGAWTLFLGSIGIIWYKEEKKHRDDIFNK